MATTLQVRSLFFFSLAIVCKLFFALRVYLDQNVFAFVLRIHNRACPFPKFNANISDSSLSFMKPCFDELHIQFGNSGAQSHIVALFSMRHSQEVNVANYYRVTNIELTTCVELLVL
jgi:hypothetical protein